MTCEKSFLIIMALSMKFSNRLSTQFQFAGRFSDYFTVLWILIRKYPKLFIGSGSVSRGSGSGSRSETKWKY
jgi:hypothetical protein